MGKKGKPMNAYQFSLLARHLDLMLGPGPDEYGGRLARVDLETFAEHCDGTLAQTEQWLREREISLKINLRLLREHGANCDCEVLLNAVSTWPGLDDPEHIEELADAAIRQQLRRPKHEGRKRQRH